MRGVGVAGELEEKHLLVQQRKVFEQLRNVFGFEAAGPLGIAWRNGWKRDLQQKSTKSPRNSRSDSPGGGAKTSQVIGGKLRQRAL